MCKNLVMLCLMLGMASAVYAWDGPVVIGDWENSMDGWIVNNPANVTTSYSDTTGVTLGSYSLKWNAAKPSDNGWWSPEGSYQFISVDRDAFMSNTKFSIDVATLQADWQWDSNAGWHSGAEFCAVINCGTGQGQNFYNVKDSAWCYPENGDTQRTLVFDYTAENQMVRDWRSLGRLGEGSWVEIWIFDKFPTYVCPPGATWYLDNAQLIPEPATMALLGLGGLALIRRKR